MDNPYIGLIAFFGFNFAPANWALCNGQLTSISDNDTLFALIGTTYGGDGVQTFALPDLRGRLPIGMGQSNQGINYVIGQAAGVEQVNVLASQIPAHTHNIAVNNSAGTSATPSTSSVLGVVQSAAGVTSKIFTTANAGNTTMAPANVGSQGGSQPISILQPILVANYCISLYGIFPSRN